eukprot:6194532-Pleurochrysis_carterae.AAC.1
MTRADVNACDSAFACLQQCMYSCDAASQTTAHACVQATSHRRRVQSAYKERRKEGRSTAWRARSRWPRQSRGTSSVLGASLDESVARHERELEACEGPDTSVVSDFRPPRVCRQVYEVVSGKHIPRGEGGV